MGGGSGSQSYTYYFAARDQPHAEALATAFSDSGFAEVSARPGTFQQLTEVGMLWEVHVTDRGPYARDLIGQWQVATAERRANAVARAHRSFCCAVLACPSAYKPPPSLDRPVVLLSPGRKPPLPAPPVTAAPPPGRLALAPDLPIPRPARLDRLAGVPWSGLECAYDAAGEIPGRITALVSGSGNWDAEFSELTCLLMHQGATYQATAPAMLVLADLVIGDCLPTPRRRDIYLTLLGAADVRDFNLLAYSDRAAALGRPPEAGPWATEVREAVGTVTPSLLARWDTEPSAIQLALAALAAAFPEHAGLVTPQIQRMASQQAGTRVGAYALLASRLVAGDGAAALAIAREIDFWDSQLLRADIDNELTSPQLRALHVLTEAVLDAVGAVRA